MVDGESAHSATMPRFLSQDREVKPGAIDGDDGEAIGRWAINPRPPDRQCSADMDAGRYVTNKIFVRMPEVGVTVGAADWS